MTPEEIKAAIEHAVRTAVDGVNAAYKVERSALENGVASLRARIVKLEKRARWLKNEIG